MFTFTSLLGAQSSSAASQSILELEGGVKVLVDCGWDETFDAEKLAELEKQLPTLSFILLTHATTAHLGAYAHCCKHFSRFTRIPVYATSPVIALGRSLLRDIYSSTPLACSTIPEAALSDSSSALSSDSYAADSKILLQPPSAEEVASYFSLIHPLKYSQPHEPLPSPFSPPLNGLKITAYSAGYSLGGTIWHIQHGLESIVYAVDWNQVKEHVLAGAAWLGPAGAGGTAVIDSLRRPTALVCSSRGADRVVLPGGIRKRDEVLLGHMKQTIKKGGTVLIPSDSTARVLELAFLLENAWAELREASEGQQLKMCLASRSCGATMRHARSMLEWMDEGVIRDFEAFSSQPAQSTKQKTHQRTGSKPDSGRVEGARSAPFDFKHIRLVESSSRFKRNLSQEGPKIILASDASLEWGFSHMAIRQLADDPKNLVILTEQMSSASNGAGNLQRRLWSLYEKHGGSVEQTTSVTGNGTAVSIQNISTTALSQTETSIYQSYLARQRQIQSAGLGGMSDLLETSADVIDDRSDTSSSSSEDSEDEQQGKILNVSAVMSQSRHKLGLSDQDLGINVLLRKKGVHDWEVRGKRGREKLFPFVREKKKNDEFGDLIKPEEYLRAEERDDGDGGDVRNGATATKKNTAVGEKRKWGDMAVQSTNLGGGSTGRVANGVNKRRKSSGDDGGRTVNAGDEDSGTSSEEDLEFETPELQGPRKIMTSQESLTLNLRIAFVDFSGRHDKRSLQMLIPLIRPRKLILVGGEGEETQALAMDCRRLLAVEGTKASNQSNGQKETDVEIFTPVVGQTVDASVDTNAWMVKLSDPLVKHLTWQNVRGLEVVALTARLRPAVTTEDSMTADADDSSKAKKLKTNKGGQRDVAQNIGPMAEQEVPVLNLPRSNTAAATRSATGPLHVGEIRLADLRRVMQAAGYSADFRGEGTLLVGGVVAVRKSGTGRIEVEGALVGSDAMGMGMGIPRGSEGIGKAFYDVRQKIYEGLAVVSGD